MTRHGVCVVLAVVIACVSMVAQAPQFPITDGTSSAPLLHRQFGGKRCAALTSRRSINDLLGGRITSVWIDSYSRGHWPTIESAKAFIGRLLLATPEDGHPSNPMAGSELVIVEMTATVEVSGTRTARIDASAFSNNKGGYAHFLDVSGCEWWARYQFE